MTYILPCSGSSTNDFGDRSSCSVHALVNAFGLTFEEAQKMASTYGRKKNDGMRVTAFSRMLKEQFNVLLDSVLGCTKSAENMRREFREGHQYQKGISLKRFMESNSKGTFVLFTREHFTVVKNGQLMNRYAMKPGTAVVCVWKV